MKLSNVQINKKLLLILILISTSSFSQKNKKDTIYLGFNINNCFHKKLKQKWNKKEGIQFNLCGKAVLLNPKKNKPDTLCNKHLQNYKITKIEDINDLMRDWYRKNKPLLIKKYGELHPRSTNKNNKFITYIIEKKNNFFIIYRVFWKNQGV